MEDTLIQDIAFWGIVAIASVLVALLLIAVMTILKRKIPLQNPEQQSTDIKIGKAIIKRIDRS